MLKIVHNGYDISYVSSQVEVDTYINTILSKYPDLTPRKIIDDKTKNYRLIVYEYRTLYQEVFMIFKD